MQVQALKDQIPARYSYISSYKPLRGGQEGAASSVVGLEPHASSGGASSSAPAAPLEANGQCCCCHKE